MGNELSKISLFSLYVTECQRIYLHTTLLQTTLFVVSKNVIDVSELKKSVVAKNTTTIIERKTLLAESYNC